MVAGQELGPARERLEILQAIARAQRGWAELLPIIAACDDPDQVAVELQRRMGLSEAQAHAVSDIQFRRLSIADKRRIDDQIRELTDLIDGSNP